MHVINVAANVNTAAKIYRLASQLYGVIWTWPLCAHRYDFTTLNEYEISGLEHYSVCCFFLVFFLPLSHFMLFRLR